MSLSHYWHTLGCAVKHFLSLISIQSPFVRNEPIILSYGNAMILILHCKYTQFDSSSNWWQSQDELNLVTKVKLCCESAAANVPAKTPTFHLCVTGSTVIPYNQRQKRNTLQVHKTEKKVFVKLIFESCKLVIDIRRAAIVSHRLYCYCHMEP